MVKVTTSSIAMSGLSVISQSVLAGSFDFVKTKTESSDTLIVYDLPSFSESANDLKGKVREALTQYGDNALSETICKLETSRNIQPS